MAMFRRCSCAADSTISSTRTTCSSRSPRRGARRSAPPPGPSHFHPFRRSFLQYPVTNMSQSHRDYSLQDTRVRLLKTTILFSIEPLSTAVNQLLVLLVLLHTQRDVNIQVNGQLGHKNNLCGIKYWYNLMQMRNPQNLKYRKIL